MPNMLADAISIHNKLYSLTFFDLAQRVKRQQHTLFEE